MTTLIRQYQRINETRLLCIQTSHVHTSRGAIYFKRLYRSGRNKIKEYASSGTVVFCRFMSRAMARRNKVILITVLCISSCCSFVDFMQLNKKNKTDKTKPQKRSSN